MRFWKRAGRTAQTTPRAKAENGRTRGILVFQNTGEVIRAESLLRAHGFSVLVKGPPPAIRTGCDMVIEFPLGQEIHVSKVLSERGLHPLEIIAVGDSLLEPVSLFHSKDLGEFLMVRAANMKLTIEKHTRRIVNVSGGGCPDVPYLAEVLVGKKLDEAPHPRELGHTLCGYALELAFQEVLRRCPGS